MELTAIAPDKGTVPERICSPMQLVVLSSGLMTRNWGQVCRVI